MDVDDQPTAGREQGTAQQTSPMAHTSSLRLVYRELTVRVIICIAGSMHEQFHCTESLFQQLYIGTEARVFHDTSPPRIMQCDADVHEEVYTYVVLSGDTTMFQDIDERMPTTSAPETIQIGQASPLHPRWRKREQGRHVDILQVISFPMRVEGSTSQLFVYSEVSLEVFVHLRRVVRQRDHVPNLQ